MAKSLILWLVVAIVIVWGIDILNSSGMGGAQDQNNYVKFKQELNEGRVSSVKIKDREITVKGTDGSNYNVIMPMFDDTLLPKLEEKGVVTTGVKPEEMNVFLSILISWFPMLLLIGVWLYFMRGIQGGGKGGALSFSKSKAKLLSEDQVKTTFADVAGCDEAKEEVKELVDYLRDPSKFQKLGGKIPRGVLLVGQPGTGKTLLAKAISGEAKVPFFSISGSDFVEMFVGVGASRVRDMFEQAKKKCPCIIFIDEIDAVGRKRGVGLGGGHDEREQTLNQMLVEMDGFDGHEAVIVIAATNRPDVLDPALLRPGRFDRQVTVGLPDVKGREQILKVHTRKVPISSDVNISLIARGTPGFSGAELANLVNEAALAAARANKKMVTMAEFEFAKDKLLMGTERKSLAMKEEEKINTAYHESGHAIVGKLVPEHDPVYKVSIIPRGRALGVTTYLPEVDRYSYTREHIESLISSLFGGRIAEELIFGAQKVTTGASNDIERATDLAQKMVLCWGMSDVIGPQLMQEPEQETFLGSGGTRTKTISAETQKNIDAEIKAILDRNYQRAKKILEENIDILHSMKDALIKFETLDAEQIDDLLARRPLKEPEVNNDKKKDEEVNEEEKPSTTENSSTTQSSSKEEEKAQEKSDNDEQK
ncbi:MAG: ATP-dependent zinc metalloprotease FtsH [Succinivibrionaceae bacterium]|nr:ATP-dependent zinc metalloprotease FtsH [Succinivibrionaceae bacterium]